MNLQELRKKEEFLSSVEEEQKDAMELLFGESGKKMNKQSFSQALMGSEAFASSSPLVRPKVSVLRKPLSFGEDSDSRVDLFQTDGRYYITYSNEFTYEALRDPEKVKEMPFVISGDVFSLNSRVPNRYRNYNHLMAMGKLIPMLGTVLEFSNISKDLFFIARRNPSVKFSFCFDFVRYEKEVGKTYFVTKDLYGKQIDFEKARSRNPAYMYRIKHGLDPVTKEKM
jgi:hypothetical protein